MLLVQNEFYELDNFLVKLSLNVDGFWSKNNFN